MRHRCLFALVLLGACNTLPKEVDPLDQDLPPLPAEGGAALCAAGRLTPTNFDKERVPGPASQGLAMPCLAPPCQSTCQPVTS